VTRELDIRPHDGVGPLRLGMTAVHVYYDADDRAEYIEVARVSAVRPMFGEVAVLDIEAPRAVAAVARHAPYDQDDPELGFSYVFKQLDLSLWRPTDDDEEPEGHTFMSVGVGRRGYYA
jgi:hypothetical protein